jgi:hypothetical protein
MSEWLRLLLVTLFGLVFVSAWSMVLVMYKREHEK